MESQGLQTGRWIFENNAGDFALKSWAERREEMMSLAASLRTDGEDGRAHERNKFVIGMMRALREEYGDNWVRAFDRATSLAA